VRIEGQLERGQHLRELARTAVAPGLHSRFGSRGSHGRERARALFLDEQAALPRAVEALRSSRAGRDYPALAALAGYGREEYRRLPPPRQRSARVEIDRQLAMRSELKGRTGRRLFDDAGPAPPAGRSETDVSGRLAWEGPYRAPRHVAAIHSGSPPSGRAGRRESAVMRDAREVAAGRKRQLGIDRS
jgi:hypothetical protein